MSTHDHDDHAAIEEGEAPPSEYQYIARALYELLLEKELFTADDVRAAMEDMDARTPAQGARVIARAWCDPEFKARLLADGSAACRELGIDTGPLRLIAVENTPEVHNLIVCTLCSCYPRPLLGRPPDWYKSRPYRSRAVNEPRAVLHEFGTVLPDNVTVRVHDSTADMRYLVVPMRPEGTEGLGEEALADLVTRDSMVGVTQVKAP